MGFVDILVLATVAKSPSFFGPGGYMLGLLWPNFYDYTYHLLVEQLSEHVAWDYSPMVMV